MVLEHFVGPWPLLQFRNQNGGIVPLILNFGTRWRWVVNFTPRSFSRCGKSPRYPIDRGLHEPQSWFKCCGWQKNLLSVTISNYVGTKLVFSTTILYPQGDFGLLEHWDYESQSGLDRKYLSELFCAYLQVQTCNLPIRYPKRPRVWLNKGLKSCYSKGGNNLNHPLSSRK
jgi:hypothetical protein